MSSRNGHLLIGLFFAASSFFGKHVLADDVKPMANPGRSHLFASLFDDQIVASNVTKFRDHTQAIAEAERFDWLVKWVLPSESHFTIRMSGNFTQTDPAPLNEVTPEPGGIRGGILVSPVFDLLDVAKRTARLPELLESVRTIPEPNTEEQRRARAAMLALIHLELGQHEEAGNETDVLLQLVVRSHPTQVADMWPEMLVVYRAASHPGGSAAVEGLLAYLFEQRTQRDIPHGLLAWHNQIASLTGRNGHLETMRPAKAVAQPLELKQWVPVSRVRSSTRGLGLPQAQWMQQQDRVDKISGHDEDYLFFRSPLTGDYEMECDISHTACQAMVAGTVVGSDGSQTQIWKGTFRDGAKQQPIDVKFSGFLPWVRYRCVVRGNVATTYLNGLVVHTEQLTVPDPWVAVRSSCRSHASARDIRITGSPIVPESIDLSASSDLRGWYPYHDESAATAGARWEHLAESESTGQIFGQANGSQGTFFESLLVYQRPLEEIGSVNYQFLYKSGVAETHPALDRMAFLLKPDGVRVHWITDSLWDSGDLPPDNLFDEPGNRRGPKELPLKPDAWNQMTVAVNGAEVSLRLNGTLIYECTLHDSNRRTFGLFHYADQSEVRVRNVTMQGNWPRTIPPVIEQELVDRAAVQLDSDPPPMKAVFTHDFGKGGFPEKYFVTEGADKRAQFTARRDGVFVNMQGKGGWIDRTIKVPFAIHGDFDIEAAFDQLRILSDNDACAFMELDLDDEQQQTFRINRIRTSTALQQIHPSMSIIHKRGGRSFAGREATACEAMKGRLRLARRGQILHYLFAENDSDNFRLIATESISDKPSKSDALVLHTLCHGTGETQVLWKSLSIRANRLTLKPGPNDRPPVNLYAMNPNGENLRKLAAPLDGFTQISSAEWSADGTKIIGDMSRGGVETSRMFVMNSDGSGHQDLGPGYLPSLSPDNAEIVFTQPNAGIRKMQLDGSGRKLLDSKGKGSQCSPDGKHIAWVVGNNVVLLDLRTNKRTKLIAEDQSALCGSIYPAIEWSLDSQSIAFKARTSDRTNTFVAVAGVDTGSRFRIIHSGPEYFSDNVAMHPDSQRVLLAVGEQPIRLSRLLLIDRNTPANKEPIPGPPSDWNILSTDWSPDGQVILFTAHGPPQPVEWPLTGG